MSKKKFKPGDIVFYISYDNQIEIRTIVTINSAKKLYKRIYGKDITKKILKECKEKNIKPVFIVDKSIGVGWMPYEKLHLMSAAMQVLYGYKHE